MKYVLKGRISMDNPYSLDKTLTIEGLGADAKAVGDALQKKVNTADIVDNLTTEDPAKPLSAKQGKVLDAKIADSVTALEATIQETVIVTKEAAEEAKKEAESAKTIVQEVQTQVDVTLAGVVKTVNGIAPDEFGNVTLPSADEVSY